MKIQFAKMHGIGNDYIYLDGFRQALPENLSDLSVKLSRRHTGIGADGIITIEPSDTADARMRIFNADGSEAMMCGNGIRCVGKYLYDNKICTDTHITVDTASGLRQLEVQIENGIAVGAKVDMGEPVLEADKIPVVATISPVIDLPIAGKRFTCVSMGNPHAVCFQTDLSDYDVLTIGPMVEHSPLFPQRINVEFARVLAPNAIEMRVWERGSGETLACGTGACATLVAAVLNGLTERKASLQLSGGQLTIEWDAQDNHVYMAGAATLVFTGEIEIEFL